MAELVGRIRANLSPTQGFASSGFGVPPLDGDDLVVLEGYVDRVGWANPLLLQPKQVERAGAVGLIQALQGTVIHLIQSEDESDTSSVETTDSSQPQDRSEPDPLRLTQGGPEREEGEWSGNSSPPEAMDQDEVQEHNTYLDGGSTSDAGLAFGQRADSQSEDMDITAQPSEAESFNRSTHGKPGCTAPP